MENDSTTQGSERLADQGRSVKRTLGRIGKSIRINPQKTDASLTAVTGIILRTLALLLLVFSILIIWRLLSNTGYVLEPFAVPQKMADETGLTGTILAARFHDALKNLKDEAASAKADSLHVGSDDASKLNLSVMGVDISLNSIAYQLGKALGRKEKSMKGEVVRSGDSFSLNFRMSDYPVVHFEEKMEGDNIEAATQKLLNRAAEEVLRNTDPYRLAIIFYRRKAFDKAVEVVRAIIRDRPHERTWAYHAWGNILMEQGRMQDASDKFQRATEIDSTFYIAFTQWGYCLIRMGNIEEGTRKLWRSAQLFPNNPDVLLTLGWMHNNLGEIAKSDSAFAMGVKAAAAFKKADIAYLSWAEAKFMQKDAKAALEKAQLASNASGSGNSESYVAKATALLLQKDSTGAYQMVLQALDLDPENLSAIIMAARSEYTIYKDYEQVIRRIEGIQFKPWQVDQKVMMMNMQAMSYNNLGRTDSAFAVIHRAIAIDTLRAYPYSTLAETYAYAGNTEAFYQTLEKAFKLKFKAEYLNLENEPYRRFATAPRFKKMLETYGKSEVLKD